jgi:hypothetical protein
MACPAYGSSSGVSIFYAVDADPDAAIGPTKGWNEVPFTSDSLAGNLTSSQSERITAARAYAGSAITAGEVSGSLGFETEANAFMNTMLQAALQSSAAPSGTAVKNGSTPMCLMFVKRIKRGAGFDYYVYRGVQVDSMSLNISPGSFITGELSLQGIRMGAGVLGASDGSNDVLDTVPVGWTFTQYTSGNIMSSVFAIQNLEVQDSAGADIGVIARELSLTLSNQLRQQQAIGTGTPFAVGIASGRFMATASLEAYYAGPTIVDAMFNDDELKLTFDLVDPDGKGWTFLMDKCKITSSPPPMAEGPDQDLMSSTDLQGFESATNGSIKVTRLGTWT